MDSDRITDVVADCEAAYRRSRVSGEYEAIARVTRDNLLRLVGYAERGIAADLLTTAIESHHTQAILIRMLVEDPDDPLLFVGLEEQIAVVDELFHEVLAAVFS